MMKRVRVLLLALAMVFAFGAFAACGGDGSDNGDTADVKLVKMWIHKSEAEDEGKIYKALATQFNSLEKKTDDGRTIVVQAEFKNTADALSTSISAEVMTGGLPDIVAVDAPKIAAYADAGILENIDSYLSTEVKNSYVDSVIEQSSYNNGLYALSGMDAPGGLYYNKSFLTQVGYTEEDFGTIANPWSWNDVRKAMVKLKNAGIEYKIKLNLGFGGDEGCMYLYSPLVYSAGGAFYGANEKINGALNGTKSVAGIRMLEQFFAAGDWIYNGTNENAFPTKAAAFEIYGPWLVDVINKNYASFKSDYGIMPYPVYEDGAGNKGTVATPCGSWGFGVTPRARDKKAAAEVVAYFTGEYATKVMFESIGTFPTNKALFNDLAAFNSGPAKSLADLLLQTAAPRPKLVKYPQLSAAYSNIIEYVESYGSSGYNLEGEIGARAAQADSI